MRRGRSPSFTLFTTSGKGVYRSRAKANSAARWVAGTTGEAVSVVNDRSGESWEVRASGREA
jgi:hypothetical protein